VAETTAANSAAAAKRTRGRPFAPGQSGNPAGRPKADPEVTAILRAAAPDAARALVEIANDPEHPDRLRACVALLDRVLGKPTERHEVQGDVMFVLRDPFAVPPRGDGHA
jgi:hypothetical protein